MPSSIVSLAAIPIVAFVLYKIVTIVSTKYNQDKLAKSLGCKPAPVYPDVDPLGIYNLVKIIKRNNIGKLPHHVMERLETVSKQEGFRATTFQTHIARNWLFFTCDPKNIQALLATQFKDFELGPVRFGTFSPLLGLGIFSADGKAWEHSRALLRPQFSRDQVSDLDLEERHLQNMMLALPTKSDGWTETTDIQPLNFRLTMDSASEFLFGESTYSQLSALPGRSGSEEDTAFVNAFEKSQDLISRAFRLNDFYSLGLTKDFTETCKICHNYINRYVRKALDQEKKEKSLETGEKEKYIFLNGLAAQTQDPVEIRDQCLSILVAGRDTTASLLGFFWLMMGENPDVFNKLRKIVISDFGTYKKPKNITFASLKGCTYLQWCMNETLRLFPTVPLNSRRSIKDTTLPHGGGPDGKSPIFVPKGTEVNYAVYATHRTKEFWGDDAEKFNAERWDGRKTGFEYLPFNGGPRICLGQQFALTEAGYVIVRLLQRFDKLDNSAMAGLEDVWNLTLTGRPLHGVRLRFHEADLK
ncbi:Cytochrome P450 [Hyphodiscus hymeniophilus]|uniref:Cytochrome P450 n=1 Tax=Hyphodiscus hymeniophilus TaxID=353542 RepID=A0A9P6VK42_9HELO|nr:Cytochrome P450 [Hyphodiscus hymeniophilus]